MRKATKYIGTSILILAATLSVIWLLIRVPNNPTPDRFSNIPDDAIWHGATDEGFWFWIVSVDSVNRHVRVKIYNDYDGMLMMDGNYSEQKGCEIEPFTADNIIDNIFYYGFDDIDLKKRQCRLILIQPALGGEFASLPE